MKSYRINLPIPRSERIDRGKSPDRGGCVAGSLNQEEPKSFKEATTSSQSNQRQKAMLEEIESINSNDTWDLVNFPERRRAVGC